MASNGTAPTERIPALGPFSSRQVAGILRASCLAFASGLVALFGLLAAMIVPDRPDLLDVLILVISLWVLPPATVVTVVDGKLDGDISWRWVLSSRTDIDP